MKLTGFIGLATGFLLVVPVAGAVEALLPHIGDTYEITMTKESTQQGTGGSSGSSHDRDTVIERLIGLRTDGLELEYDLPKSAQSGEKTSNWAFPFRVFKPYAGAVRLLNGPELEGRIDNWLKAGKLTRAACGHWIFTWNAFRIECDPLSVIKTVEAFNLPTSLRDGDTYHESNAEGAGTLTAKSSRTDGAIFTVVLPISQDSVRRAHAETDLVVGEIMHKPVTIDDALQRRAKEVISGTISITFETDAAGLVQRRTKVTKLEIIDADGQSETETVTETLERHLIARGK